MFNELERKLRGTVLTASLTSVHFSSTLKFTFLGLSDRLNRVLLQIVDVTHRCRDISVAQEFLDCPQIHPVFQPMSRPEVAEVMF